MMEKELLVEQVIISRTSEFVRRRLRYSET